ncbi:hypothetical protein SAMN05518871_10194 [Psychrobacillus sp. OK028]|nr:hypothetical protein SAMN05518871_10194 [Psychrobacillus sp. OK028]
MVTLAWTDITLGAGMVTLAWTGFTLAQADITLGLALDTLIAVVITLAWKHLLSEQWLLLSVGRDLLAEPIYSQKYNSPFAQSDEKRVS